MIGRMGKIHLLSEETINQIAAGEVVENPASVIKELVDNAIDAEAKRICVEIKGGGFLLIRVVDDGCGMSEEDARLSLQRHATSKIRSAVDLQTITTMGFRGEALASIASISKLRLSTAQEGETAVQLEEGEVSPVARGRGTTVEVRSLFYNVPARKKFQKSVAASVVEIQRVLTHLSLAHPEISFEFVNNDQVVFSFSAKETLEERIAVVLGEEFMKGGMKVQAEGVEGFVASPSNTRPNRLGQFLCVNRRPVISMGLSFAVKEAFATAIDPDRFVQFVLHLDLDPHLVDVNVHPQKKEVRFQDEQELKRKIRQAIAVEPLFMKPVFHIEPVNFSFPPLVFREEPREEESILPLRFEFQAIGIFEHYLFIDGATVPGYGEGIVCVDLLAAKERIALEQMEKGKVMSQALLIPETIELSPLEAKTAELHKEELEKMGLAMRPMGKTSFIIEAIPAFLEVSDVKELVFRVSEGEEVLKSASQLARGKKRVFMVQEGMALFRELMTYEGSRCHIVAHLKREDLERLF